MFQCVGHCGIRWERFDFKTKGVRVGVSQFCFTSFRSCRTRSTRLGRVARGQLWSQRISTVFRSHLCLSLAELACWIGWSVLLGPRFGFLYVFPLQIQDILSSLDTNHSQSNRETTQRSACCSRTIHSKSAPNTQHNGRR